MATFNEVKGHNSSNIRKILEFALFAKPYDADALDDITQIWTEVDGLMVSADYEPIGHTTKGDTSWTRDQDWQDVESHGYGEPTRRDNAQDVEGLSFTAQETNKLVLELYRDADLSGITPDSDGNLVFKKGSRPAGRRWHVLAIGKDGDGPDAIYMAKWLPNAQVTEMGEMPWSEEDEVRYEISMTAFTDSTVGSSMVDLLGGPGLDHEAMGFPAPAAGGGESGE